MDGPNNKPGLIAESSFGQSSEEFSKALATHYDGRVRALPDFAESIDHTGKIPLFVEKYRRINGLYLDGAVTDDMGSNRVPEITFQPRPFRRLGREDSRRGVFFGDLILSADHQLQVPVAVKPLRASFFHHAVQELGMYQLLDAERVATLKVLGVMAVAQTGAEQTAAPPDTYLITKEEPGITTLDNVNWQTLSDTERWVRMRAAIDTMKLLHERLVFHGDLKFKNVAQGEADRSTRIVDTEYATSIRDQVTPYEDKADERVRVAKKMNADFSDVCHSVNDEIIGPGASDSEKFEEHLEYVLAPYYVAIMHSDSPYQGVLKSAFELVIEQRRKQATG